MRWRRALIGIAIVPAAVVIAMASAWAHFHEELGRRAFAELITRNASGEIPGELVVEDVTRVDLPHVRAGRLAILTEEGLEVLVVRDLDLEIDALASIWHGGPIVRHAHIGSGRVQLAASPNGRMWLERALVREEEIGREPTWRDYIGMPGQMRVLLDDVRFDHLVVDLATGGPRMTLANGSGHARIWLPDREDVQMRYWGVSGMLHTHGDVLPNVHVASLALAVDPASPTFARLLSRFDAMGARMTVMAQVPTDGAPRVCVWTGGPSVGSLFAHLGASFSSGLDISITEARPPGVPRCEQQRGS